MKNKNILKTIIVSSLFLMVNPVTMAEELHGQVARTATTVALQRNAKEEIASKRAEMKSNIIGLKKDNAYKEIDRRTASMNNMIAKITSVKRLTEVQKSTLISQVNAEIARLKTLRAKIEADTVATTLTEDKKSIVTSYRIYALFMPKMTIIAHANAVLDLVDLMLAKNPTAEALSKINVAKTMAEGAIANVVNLTPDGYPANKTQLQSANTTLQTARLNLVGARGLMK